MPGLEVASAVPKPRETITAFLRRTGWAFKDKEYGWQFKKGLPTVLEVNGKPVLRRFWRTTRIAANDNIRFLSFPLGAGGRGSSSKQIAGMVALVAVSAFALWAGPLVAASFFAGSSIAGGLTTAAIGIGGSLLVNALVGPNPGATNAPNSTQDQIYSVQAQGNTAKLGQPLPVPYGRTLWYPDFAATPWSEFVGNNQYLNILLSIGMGSLSYEALYVDQTVLWDPVHGVAATFANPGFDGSQGAQIAFYKAGSPVTLFPTNVDASAEVTGQQFPSGSGWQGITSCVPGAVIGPFVANPSGTLTQAIAVDWVMPSGCFAINNSSPNSPLPQEFRLIAQYAPVNDAGTLIGSFTTLFDVTRTYNSQSPVRDSIKVNVPAGRYTVQVQRGDSGFGGPGAGAIAVWAGLRSFLEGSNVFADVDTVAIRILADQSTQGSYKFGVLGTRMLPVWNGSSFVTQATRNPAWAFLDAVTNSQYGSMLDISKVDFNAIVNHATGCDSRGDYFDYVFSTAVAVPAAFDKILTVSRARHFWLGDTVSIVRDEYKDVPNMMLTDREIVRDSTQVSWTMLGDEDPDAVIIEYIDNGTWLPATVQYPPDVVNSFTALNAETKRIDGIVDRNQAFRECAFYYLQSIYRRENVQIDVEYEGRAIQFGSCVRVQSELPMAYGYGGAVIGVNGSALTLDPVPVWDIGPFYIRLRMPNGTWFGPVTVTASGNGSIANLDATTLAAAQTAQNTTLAAVLARDAGAEYPSFELGTADSQSKLCVVLSGVPKGELCTLSMVVDDPRVHATSLGNPPILPTKNYPVDSSAPQIYFLNATLGQGTAEPLLSASWFPAPGAFYYIADVSYNSGGSWQNVYEGMANQFSVVVQAAALILRVQAVGKERGAYSTISLAAPTISIAAGTVTEASFDAALSDLVKTSITQANTRIAQIADFIGEVAADQDAANRLDKHVVKSELAETTVTTNASINVVQSYASTTQAAFASYQITTNASVGTLNSNVSTLFTTTATTNGAVATLQTDVGVSDGTSLYAHVSTNATAIATINGKLAAEYIVTLDVNGYVSSLKAYNDGSFSSWTFVGSIFEVAFPGTTGGSPTTVFQIGTVSGSPAIVLQGNMYADGTISARHMSAGSITALNAALGPTAVTSLNIAGNAVTVPTYQTLNSAVSGNSAYQLVLGYTVNVDTTGLSGSPMTLFALFNAAQGYGNGLGTYYAQIQFNGTTAQLVGGTSVDTNVTCSATYQFTGTGGMVSIVVNAYWWGETGYLSLGDRTLFSMVVKR